MTTTAFQHWSALHAWWCARQHEREAVGRQWAPRKTRTDVPAESEAAGLGQLSAGTTPMTDAEWDPFADALGIRTDVPAESGNGNAPKVADKDPIGPSDGTADVPVGAVSRRPLAPTGTTPDRDPYAKLQELTRSAYMVNEKNPRTYDREWKLHILLMDGTVRDYVGADSVEGQHDIIRKAMRDVAAADVPVESGSGNAPEAAVGDSSSTTPVESGSGNPPDPATRIASSTGTTPVNDILPRHAIPQHALDELAVDRDIAARRASYAEPTVKPRQHPSTGKRLVTAEESSTLTPDPARQALVEQRGQLNPNPSQGADLSDKEFDTLWAALKDQYDRLELPARAWRARLAKQAQRRGVSFLAQDAKTERCYHVNRSLVSLGLTGVADDYTLRVLLAAVLGDIAFAPRIEAGWLVGSLDAAQAERFSQIVDEWLAPPPPAA